jgi:cation-transporting ATPase 13A2
MYTYALNVGNYQYLIQDLFFTTVLAALMGFTEPRCAVMHPTPSRHPLPWTCLSALLHPAP